MGKNNRARRAAKAKARSRAQATSRERARRRDQADADDRSGHGAAGPSGATGHGGGEGHRQTNDIFGDSYRADPEGWTHDLLVDAGSFQHQEKRNRRYNSDLRTAVLRQLGRVPLDVLATAAERALLGRVEALWQGGWQPVELLRQARLNGSKAITARLMAQVVANDDARRRAATLDSRWISQVEALDLPAADAKPGWIRRWVGGEGLDLADARDALIDALAVMFLPRLECLIPPPGSLGAASTRSKPVRGDTSSERDPMLERIRALLAKAESTDFEEEAMAFTTKAQELITRHAIDEAMLADADATSEQEPSIIRVPIDPPYWDAKGFMLQLVAERSRCRAVMMDGLNMSRVVGYPADLTAVELLFTSLLIQAQTALAQAGKTAPPGTRTRSTSYRSSFLVAYAHRIGDRLSEINAAVASDVAEREGGGFLPVLRAREDCIDDFMAENYGDTVSGSVRGGYDPAAAAHGSVAADSAQLSFGDVEGNQSSSPDVGAAPLAALPAT